MKDIVKYLEIEIRTRQEQLEYCRKYNDPRQAKFIEKNIERLHTSINILSAKADTDNKTKALNICDVSKRSELLKAQDEEVSFDAYVETYYKKPKIEVTYVSKYNGKTITEKALIKQYMKAMCLL